MTVAILGASGIGKNHAAWFAGHGCEVVSFLGSSPDSIEATTEVLRGKIGFAGKGFHDLDALLDETQPELVCVSTPPLLHHAQAAKCLRAGAHVLCEKPLVGDDVEVGARSWHDIAAEGDSLIRVAAAENRVFGTQMQYGHAAKILANIAGLGSEPLREWSMEFETKTVRPGRHGAQIWIDLSPHPLSILQKHAGPIEIAWSTASCRIDDMETEANFTLRLAGQDEPCAARIVTRCNPDREAPLRRITMNGKSIDYAARRNEAGEFKAFFSDGIVTREEPDLVDLLVGNFVRACRGEEDLLVTGEDGARNVEMQLRLMDHR